MGAQPSKHDAEIALAVTAHIQVQVEDATAAGKLPRPESVLFSAAMGGIQNERARTLGIIDAMGRAALAERDRCAGLETAARMAAQHGAGDMASGQKSMHETALRCLLALKGEITRDPDACPKCKGSGQVPSRLVPGVTVNCEACAPLDPAIPPG